MDVQIPHFQGQVGEPPDCSKCPLRYKKKVYPEGPIPARIALVGESPGYYEERQGRPFVGASGQLLWEQLGPASGLIREEVWVTNVLLCAASDVRLETGAKLPKKTVIKLAAECCRARLISELKIIKPEVIIPVGADALQAVTGVAKPSIKAYRGSILQVDLQAMV